MIDETLQKLAESGILGLLLVISLFTIGYLFKEYKNERDLRISDLQKYSDDDKKFIIEIKEILSTILSMVKEEK